MFTALSFKRQGFDIVFQQIFLFFSEQIRFGLSGKKHKFQSDPSVRCLPFPLMRSRLKSLHDEIFFVFNANEFKNIASPRSQRFSDYVWKPPLS